MLKYNVGDTVEILEDRDDSWATTRIYPKGAVVVVTSRRSKEELIENCRWCNEKNTENIYRVCYRWEYESNWGSRDMDMVIRESRLKPVTE